MSIVPSSKPNYSNYLVEVAEKKNKIKEQLAEKAAQLEFRLQGGNQFYYQNKASLDESINLNKANIYVIIMQVYKPKQYKVVKGNESGAKPDIRVHSFIGWVGNLKGSSVQDGREENGILYLPIREEEKTEGNDKAQYAKKKVIDEYPVQSFSFHKFSALCTVGTPQDLSFSSIKYGDLVLLRDVYVSTFKTKEGQNIDKLNARSCDIKEVKGNLNRLFRSRLDAFQKNRKFERCTKKYDPSTGFAEQTDKEIFFVDNTIDYSALAEKDTAIVTQTITYDQDAWIYKKPIDQNTKQELPAMATGYSASQWSDDFGKPENVFIQANFKHSELFPNFGIADATAWYELARCFMRHMSFFVIGNVNVKRTIEKTFNQKGVDENVNDESTMDSAVQDETEVGEEEHEGPKVDLSGYKYALVYNGIGLITDFPSWLEIYGIKVSKKWLLARFKNYKPNKIIVDQHVQLSSAIFTCLSENQNPIGIINADNGSLSYRVIVSYDFTQSQMAIVSKLSVKEGEELIEFLTRPSSGGQRLLPKGHPLEKDPPNVGNQMIRDYAYALQMSELAKPSFHATKFFLGSDDIRPAERKQLTFNPAQKTITYGTNPKNVNSNVVIEEIDMKKTPVDEEDEIEASENEEKVDFDQQQPSLSDQELEEVKERKRKREKEDKPKSKKSKKK
jgi:hypothetical protein